MNIDKFGHHVHKRLRLSDFIESQTDTLIRSAAGDFDLKLSKLKGLRSPGENDEAVNKEYMDKRVEELRNEMKKIQSDVRKYLKSLEITFSDRLSTLYYTKEEIDKFLNQAKSNKNE